MGYSIDFLTNNYGDDVLINLNISESDHVRIYDLEKEDITIYVERDDLDEGVIYFSAGNGSEKEEVIIEDEIVKAPLSVVNKFKDLYKDKKINYVGVQLVSN